MNRSLYYFDTDKEKEFKSDFPYGNIKLYLLDKIYENKFIVTTDNRIYSKGYNRKGLLGLGHDHSVKNFTRVQGNYGIIEHIACNSVSFILVNKEGDLYISGSNPLDHLDKKKYNILTNSDWYMGRIKQIMLSPYGRNMFLNYNGDLYNVNLRGRIDLIEINVKKFVDYHNDIIFLYFNGTAKIENVKYAKPKLINIINNKYDNIFVTPSNFTTVKNDVIITYDENFNEIKYTLSDIEDVIVLPKGVFILDKKGNLFIFFEKKQINIPNVISIELMTMYKVSYLKYD